MQPFLQWERDHAKLLHLAARSAQDEQGWHTVGATIEEPAFLNGWASGVNAVRFMADDLGRLYISGTATRAAGGSLLPIFALPVGYRPNEDYFHFDAAHNFFDPWEPIEVEISQATGEVRLTVATFNTVEFRATPVAHLHPSNLV